MTSEFGGCLPIESFLLSEPQAAISPNVVQLNSGRSAIYYAVRHSGCHTLYLPYYTCPTIRKFVEARGIHVKEYSICPDYSPNVPSIKEGEILLWTNYYGCMKSSIIADMAAVYGSRLILDNCQAFFAEPVSTAYCIYSIRKFIGVPCGSYIFLPEGDVAAASQPELEHIPYDDRFLRVAKEQGSNAAYSLYLENEESFKRTYGAIPEKVKDTLQHVDFQTIQSRRSANFLTLHKVLGRNNPLPLDFNSQTAYMYPYFSEREHLQSSLLKHNIFAPTWWKRVLTLSETSEFEKKLVRHIVPLPIDHRYSEDQMLELACIVQGESR